MVMFVSEPSHPGFLVDYDPILYSQQANLVADGHGHKAVQTRRFSVLNAHNGVCPG